MTKKELAEIKVGSILENVLGDLEVVVRIEGLFTILKYIHVETTSRNALRGLPIWKINSESWYGTPVCAMKIMQVVNTSEAKTSYEHTMSESEGV